MKAVVVDWEDIVNKSGWQKISKINEKDFAACRTIGYVVDRNDERITLTATYGPNDGKQTLGVTIIPMGCVKKIRNIKF